MQRHQRCSESAIMGAMVEPYNLCNVSGNGSLYGSVFSLLCESKRQLTDVVTVCIGKYL